MYYLTALLYDVLLGMTVIHAVDMQSNESDAGASSNVDILLSQICNVQFVRNDCDFCLYEREPLRKCNSFHLEDFVLIMLQAFRKLHPENAIVSIQGTGIQQKKRFTNALIHCCRSTGSNKSSGQLYEYIGSYFYNAREYTFAIQAFEEAVRVDRQLLPRIAHALALSYHFIGDDITAERLYSTVNDRNADFYFDYGVTLQAIGKIMDAAFMYQSAIRNEKTFAKAWLNLATLHQQYGDASEAIFCYKVIPFHLLRLDIKLREMASVNLGIAFEQTFDSDTALHWYKRALNMITDRPSGDNNRSKWQLYGHIARAERAVCLWESNELYRDILFEIIMQTEAVDIMSPFYTLLMRFPASARKKVASDHADSISRKVRQYKSSHKQEKLSILPPTAQLRVGYLSYDFADHPTAYLLQGLFTFHDDNVISATAFSYGRNDGSEVRQRIENLAANFENLSNLSTLEAVNLLIAHKIHILMDAQGHTRGNRPEILANKPAPIIVNFLAYPGTSGASFIDYMVTDRFVTSIEYAEGFSEKLIYLPYSYQVNYYPDNTCNGSGAANKPSNGREFLFVNYNKVDKLDPVVFAVWMSILSRVPNSYLTLLDGASGQLNAEKIKSNLRSEAASRGIHPARIKFVPRVGKEEHIKRLHVADLFLDTFEYGAHSTATDVLHAGVPVLTLAGDSFASRVGVSLLSNIELEILVTYSLKEYEDTAGSQSTFTKLTHSDALSPVYLAGHPDTIAQVRSHIHQRRFHLNLFDTGKHTRSLESALKGVYDIKLVSNITSHIIVL